MIVNTNSMGLYDIIAMMYVFSNFVEYYKSFTKIA